MKEVLLSVATLSEILEIYECSSSGSHGSSSWGTFGFAEYFQLQYLPSLSSPEVDLEVRMENQSQKLEGEVQVTDCVSSRMYDLLASY